MSDDLIEAVLGVVDCLDRICTACLAARTQAEWALLHSDPQAAMSGVRCRRTSAGSRGGHE